jgi:hypothetical protein
VVDRPVREYMLQSQAKCTEVGKIVGLPCCEMRTQNRLSEKEEARKGKNGRRRRRWCHEKERRWWRFVWWSDVFGLEESDKKAVWVSE